MLRTFPGATIRKSKIDDRIIDFSAFRFSGQIASTKETHQVVGFVLVHLGDGLMVLGGHGESSHVRVDVDGLQQAGDGFSWIDLWENIF